MPSESGDNTASNTQKNDGARGAGVRFPPPLIWLLCLIGGIVLHYQLPLTIGFVAPLNLLGLIFVIGAFVILAISALAFRRAATAIEPWKPTTRIIYNGCYEYSRNPIYLSFCLLLFGIGITANSLWILLSAIPCAIAIHYVAIVREEAYLAKQFGADYLQYKNRVRRWL